MTNTSQQRVVLMGATGSIGDSTLDVLDRNRESFELYAVSAHSNYKKLEEICQKYHPKYAVITDIDAYKSFQCPNSTKVIFGIEELCRLCETSDVDIVVAGIVGSAGMLPVLSTVRAGKTLLLANKEALIVAGQLVMEEAKKNHAKVVPLDSEHNAIYQCLPDSYQAGKRPESLKKIILTASGGPFWNTSKEEFESITPEQACAHPNWDMGRKISVDSATLMNKGLEVIEAHWLFELPADMIDVHVHPQSIIHSMVCYKDGSVLAQMGEPDMRIPISHGLGLGRRIPSGAGMLNLLKDNVLNFYPPDLNKFPCLRLARESIDAGGTAMAVLNFANEVAVEHFLNERILFTDIAKINEMILNQWKFETVESIDQLLNLDQRVRQVTKEMIESR